MDIWKNVLIGLLVLILGVHYSLPAEVALNTEHRLNDKQEEILAALARIEGKLEK